MTVRAPRRKQDIHGEDDQRSAHKAFANRIQTARQREVQGDHRDAEQGDGAGVAQGVEQAKAHALTPAALHAGDVGNGRKVVVVEAVAQAQQQT